MLIKKQQYTPKYCGLDMKEFAGKGRYLNKKDNSIYIIMEIYLHMHICIIFKNMFKCNEFVIL